MMTTTRFGFVLGAAFALVACGGEDDGLKPPGNLPAPGEGGGGGEGGGDAGGSTGNGGSGDATCGDGVVGEGEACDGGDLDGTTCEGLGYEWGTPTCADDCTISAVGCFATETCFDGGDDDGDGDADCDDADECAAACADACAGVAAVGDPGVVAGTVSGHASVITASCTSGLGPDGGEVAFSVTAETTGVLDVELASDENLVVSVRSACAELDSEIACANDAGPADSERLAIAVTAGETVILVVEGYGAGDAGAFTLGVESRAVVCGDGHSDLAEGCDDGNDQDGDGCDAACGLELTESEPNDDPLEASPLADPFVGEIAPAGDVDFVEIEVASGPASLVVEAYDTDGSCAAMTADSYLEIWNADGTELLATDDDGGEGYCARVGVGGLAAGTYLIRVSASPWDDTAQFAYNLMSSVHVDVCGDGVHTVAEQCDDANISNGDGCDAACGLELTETEPNDLPEMADVYAGGWRAFIDAEDEDYVAVTVGTGQKLQIQVNDLGSGACATEQMDSFLQVFAQNGTVLIDTDDDDGVGLCSFIQTPPLAAGTYHVRVITWPMEEDASFFYGLNVTIN